MTAFVETLLDLNKELENTDFHRKPAQNTAVVLREVAKFFPEIARTINTSKVAVPNWRAEFETFYQELAVILEENGTSTTTQVANAERRDALESHQSARCACQHGSLSELARLQDEVNELTRALSTRAPLPPCGDCGFGLKGHLHRRGGCDQQQYDQGRCETEAGPREGLFTRRDDKVGPRVRRARLDKCIMPEARSFHQGWQWTITHERGLMPFKRPCTAAGNIKNTGKTNRRPQEKIHHQRTLR
jgi:hypothetical protein